MNRIERLCSLLTEAETFADVGCDHGYMAEYMLGHDLCKRAYVTDISPKSLQKAEHLLEKYIEAGRCVPVVCDGLKGVPADCDFVLIAGMGGEEIVRILSDGFLPKRFLFQPMKNTEKLRRYLIACGVQIGKDFTFSDGKKDYDVLLGTHGGSESYTEREFRYGRDNLKGLSPDFLRSLSERIERTEERLKLSKTEENRRSLEKLKAELEEIGHELKKDL